MQSWGGFDAHWLLFCKHLNLCKRTCLPKTCTDISKLICIIYTCIYIYDICIWSMIFVVFYVIIYYHGQGERGREGKKQPFVWNFEFPPERSCFMCIYLGDVVPHLRNAPWSLTRYSVKRLNTCSGLQCWDGRPRSTCGVALRTCSSLENLAGQREDVTMLEP